MLDRSGGALHMMGGPPAEDETDIYMYNIPDSRVSIRIWPGGMARYGQYCLEFFNTDTHKTVNTPNGFGIHGLGRPGMFQFQQPLVSWERAFNGNAPIHEGCKKYSVPEGSHWRLTRPGHEDFLFTVRTRAAPQFNAPIPYVRPA
ncbi:hypothetical protein EWM64_g8693 [Hericium alpestre]|uniref:Uncharacterized protein n=1 Tax=Hericium alpestre TaxID=135208 RepID=A0A4Y9ZP71_9AGAM|nr:hypothetical protein EWM64_g8693 [Hericium alpestre]